MFINNMAKLCKFKKIANFCVTKYFVGEKNCSQFPLFQFDAKLCQCFAASTARVSNASCASNASSCVMRALSSQIIQLQLRVLEACLPKGVSIIITHLSLPPPNPLPPLSGGRGGGAERKHEDKKVEEKFVYSLGLSFCKILCIYCSVQEDTFVSLQCL